ncbi:MAG: DUF2062 domain-containing protein [Desulfobacterales bacterium]
MYKFFPILRVTTFLQKTYERFLKIRGSPREIALGLALGLFVGMTPLMGFHTAIAVFFAAIFKWNKISSAVGVWVSNPLTAPFVYSATYVVGAKVSGSARPFTPPGELSFSIILNLLQKTPEIFWTLIVGGVILGLPLAALGYYFAYQSVLKYQQGLRAKIAEKIEKTALKQRARKRRKKRQN